jgi:hypothetical protein
LPSLIMLPIFILLDAVTHCDDMLWIDI